MFRYDKITEETTRQGIPTRDIRGTYNTVEITDAIIENLSKVKAEV